MTIILLDLGDTEMDDLFGALIVRRSAKLEPHRTLYDEDNHEHLIYLSEWTSRSGQSTLLINGMSAGKVCILLLNPRVPYGESLWLLEPILKISKYFIGSANLSAR